MPPIETELGELRRRIAKLSRNELMLLVEGVLVDMRTERANDDRQTRDELERLVEHERKQVARDAALQPEHAT